MRVREMRAADLSEVAAIWNAEILGGTGTFASEPKGVAGLAAWLAAGGPRLVAERDGAVVGFAAAGPFRPGSGYLQCLEHTLYVVSEARGAGAGRALMAALVAAARAAGAHCLVAAISGENEGAIAFHRRIGFVEAGRLREAGLKFGRRLDLVLMQRML